MDIKIIAMVAASLLCSAVFVGCSCSKSIDKDEKQTDQIKMDAQVTLSSKASYTTSETEYEKTTSTTTTKKKTSTTKTYKKKRTTTTNKTTTKKKEKIQTLEQVKHKWFLATMINTK